MKKSILLVAILVLGVFFIFFRSECFDLKITLETPNENPEKIDENVAKNVENLILQLKEVRDLIIISSNQGLSAYCKFGIFAPYNATVDKIKRRLNSAGFCDLIINDKYYLKYHYFIVIHSKNDDYYELKNRADLVLDKLLNTKISNDIKILGLEQKADYIHFSSNTLQNYNISIEDIKNIIQNENIKQDFIIKNENKNIYTINTNSSLRNTKDIENIALRYNNSNFSTKFKDVFKIEKTTKYPFDSCILYNDEKAIVLALSKRFYYPEFALRYILRDFDVEIINPSTKKRSEFYLNNSANAKASAEAAKKIQEKLKGENNLYFIGINPPKSTRSEGLDEIMQNRIVFFGPKFREIDTSNIAQISKNEKEILAPIKIPSIKYEINDYNLKDLRLEKKDVIDSLRATYDGLLCDKYKNNNDTIEIILKNKDKFIYSKKLKSLISQDSILNSSFESHYTFIARKNHRYISIIKSKSPSLIRGAQLQIRYLLSL